ncbi:chemotaxis protein CheA [Mediterraneibacter sp. NSJ-55]|uniref:Chemotaxis protein CheA n=1 Tax=Mediterraneibacter hominis TaxID=2763054 RepID=A0A923RSH4_9FIRM|nr:chemotaxis protein CheA [Mediterraneibacter hominis]MBC5689327.1 chemotaxis protein CheA [Mediterraneibacter hominis]
MDNVTDSLLDTYLFETNSLLEQLDELLINAEKNGDFTEDDVNEIFRSMHTIKGSSAMLEFNSLMEIAHHIEDLFFYIRENGTSSLNPQQKGELFNLMFKSEDRLREEVEKVENNEPLSVNIDSFIQEINNFLNKISNSGNAAQGEAKAAEELKNTDTPPFTSPEAAYCIRLFFDEGCGMENLRAFMLVTALKENGYTFTYSPQDIETDSGTSQSIINDGFFIGFSSKEEAEKASLLIAGSNNVHSYELIEKHEEEASPGSSAVQQNEAGTQKQADTPSPKNAAVHTAGKQNLISVNLAKLDSLMALVGEIVITESMVTSSPDLKGLKLDNFMKSARQLRKLTDDLQDISMSLRMVPVSGVFQKMNRIVRDMKKTLDKDVRLTLIGEDTELDKSIVDSISDPIMHIVRNSMDHGIEATREERIAAGKNPQGEIILSAVHTGNEIIISVKDDGQGVNPQKVLEKAQRNNFLSKPAEEYTKKEILSLLMEPGFSTNNEVTEYSGRGVGMDVVKKNIEAIGGVVSISSEEGEGTCTTLKIPLTLAIVDGMEISVGNSVYTVPISNIRQSFKASRDSIIFDDSGHEIIRCMDEFYPVVRLHDLYGIYDNVCTEIDDGILMWVEANDISYCLFVDQLLGEQQVVVKPLPGYLNNFSIKNYGVSGCTILGDGNISIILDIASIYSAVKNTY